MSVLYGEHIHHIGTHATSMEQTRENREENKNKEKTSVCEHRKRNTANLKEMRMIAKNREIDRASAFI